MNRWTLPLALVAVVTIGVFGWEATFLVLFLGPFVLWAVLSFVAYVAAVVLLAVLVAYEGLVRLVHAYEVRKLTRG